MLDVTPQAAGSWLEQNFWNLVEVGGLLITLAAGYTRLVARVENNERETAKEFGRLNVRVEGLEVDVDAHCDDRQIHWDPVRDERRMQNIEKMVAEIHGRVFGGGGEKGRHHHGGEDRT